MYTLFSFRSFFPEVCPLLSVTVLGVDLIFDLQNCEQNKTIRLKTDPAAAETISKLLLSETFCLNKIAPLRAFESFIDLVTKWGGQREEEEAGGGEAN